MGVDERVRLFVESREFLIGNLDERKALTKIFLEDLVGDGLVRNPQYVESSQMFTFVYADGSQGGIDLKQKDPKLN